MARRKKRANREMLATMASMATQIRDPQFCAATCAVVRVETTNGDRVQWSEDITQSVIDRTYQNAQKSNEIKEKKQLKAEAKAQMLLKEMIGADQWKIYRNTNRLMVKPGKYFWIIGDVFLRYRKRFPFHGKPDVVRIDDVEKLYITEFCVDQYGGEQTPYTDKVISFAVYLTSNERSFIRKINRIGGKKFNKMRECATWIS